MDFFRRRLQVPSHPVQGIQVDRAPGRPRGSRHRRCRHRHGLAGDQRGQALVEMALVLPILLLLVMAIIEFGWVFYGYLAITHSSREGARVGVTHPSDETILNAVQTAAASFSSQVNKIEDSVQFEAGPTASGEVWVAIAPGKGQRKSGNSLQVTLKTAINPFTPLMAAILGQPLILTHQTTMRIE